MSGRPYNLRPRQVSVPSLIPPYRTYVTTQNYDGNSIPSTDPDAHQAWGPAGRSPQSCYLSSPSSLPSRGEQRRTQNEWEPTVTHRDGQAGSSRSYSVPQRRDLHTSSRSLRPCRPDSPGRNESTNDTRQGGPYVPPHRQPQVLDQVPTAVPPTRTPPIPDLDAASSWLSRRKSPSAPLMGLPPADYLELSRPIPSIGTGKSQQISVTPKLLILDLNGALLYRSRSSNGRSASPRPYLSCFLQYLFLLDPASGPPESHDPPARPWEVFVWSSAQPHNVRSMVEACFGMRWSEGIWNPESDDERAQRVSTGEGRLIGVWARDRMGLSATDYAQKVQTTKDLRLVAEHLNQKEMNDKHATRHLSYDERTMVLLDDSPLKAIFQPWNQIVIPEYDKLEHQASQSAAASLQGDQDEQTAGLDVILLAVIGILDELRHIDNVPRWVRGGGLTAPNDHEDQSSVSRKESAHHGTPSIESLPSHASFIHWYTIPAVLATWVERGKTALHRRGIQVSHGVDPDPFKQASLTAQYAPYSYMPRYMPNKNEPTSPQPFLSTRQRFLRVYSPSRPMGDDFPSDSTRTGDSVESSSSLDSISPKGTIAEGEEAANNEAKRLSQSTSGSSEDKRSTDQTESITQPRFSSTRATKTGSPGSVVARPPAGSPQADSGQVVTRSFSSLANGGPALPAKHIKDLPYLQPVLVDKWQPNKGPSASRSSSPADWRHI